MTYAVCSLLHRIYTILCRLVIPWWNVLYLVLVCQYGMELCILRCLSSPGVWLEHWRYGTWFLYVWSCPTLFNTRSKKKKRKRTSPRRGLIKDSKCGFGRDCGFSHDRENRSNAEIAAKTRFNQLKILSNAVVWSRIGHILNPWAWCPHPS